LDPTQLSDSGLSTCVSLLTDTITSFTQYAGIDNTADVVIDTLSDLLKEGNSLSDTLLTQVENGLTAIATGTQQNLAIGEDPREFVTDNLRVLIVVNNPEDLLTTKYKVPRSDYESLENTPDEKVLLNTSLLLQGNNAGLIIGTTIVTMPSNPEAINFNSSDIRVTTTTYTSSSSIASRRLREVHQQQSRQLSSSSTHPTYKTKTMLPSIYAGVDRQKRELSDLNIGSNAIGVELLLTNLQGIIYDEQIPVYRNVTCRREGFIAPYKEVITCPTGHTTTVLCTGTLNTYNVTCPSYTDVPQCRSYDSTLEDYAVNPHCEVLAFTSDATKCACYGTLQGDSSSSSRRMFDDSNNNASQSLIDDTFTYGSNNNNKRRLSGTEVTQQFVASMGVLRKDFKQVYTIPPSLTEVQQDTVKMTIGIAVSAFFIAFLLGLVLWDHQELIRARRNKLMRDKKNRTVNTLFDKIMPPELRSGRWLTIWIHFLYIDHSWISLLAPYTQYRDFRTVKLARIFNHVILIFLFNTIFVRTFFADDGTCEDIIMGNTCQNEESFAAYRLICKWRTDNESCEFDTPIIDVLNLILFVSVVTLLTIFLGHFLDLMAKAIFNNKESVLRQKIEWNDLKNVKQVVPDSDGLEEYWERVDELKEIQTMKQKILYAARLYKLQQCTDFVSPLIEAEILGEKGREEKARNPLSLAQLLTRKYMEKQRAAERAIKQGEYQAQGERIEKAFDDDVDVEEGGTPLKKYIRNGHGHGHTNHFPSPPMSPSGSPSSPQEKQDTQHAIMAQQLKKLASQRATNSGSGGRSNANIGVNALKKFAASNKSNNSNKIAISPDAPSEASHASSTDPLDQQVALKVVISPHSTPRDLYQKNGEEKEEHKESSIDNTQSLSRPSSADMDLHLQSHSESDSEINSMDELDLQREAELNKPQQTQSLWTRLFGQVKPKPRLLSRVLGARMDALKVKHEVQLLENDQDKEVYLLKCFILEHLHGSKKSLLQRYFFSEGRHLNPNYTPYHTTKKYISIVLLPLLWCAILYGIYFYQLPLGSRSSMIWLVFNIVSIIMDAGIVQPGRIFLKSIVVNGTVTSDMKEIISTLKKRMCAIMMRSEGVLRDANAHVQHFNPACRVARLFPHLPASRFLMSLNDSDVPYALKQKGGSLQTQQGWIAWFVITATVVIPSTLLMWLTSLPVPIQDLAMELFMTTAFIAFTFVIYAFSLANPFLALVILFIAVASIVLKEIKLSMDIAYKKRKHAQALEEARDKAKLESLYGGGSGLDTSLDKSIGMGGVDDMSSIGGSILFKPPGTGGGGSISNSSMFGGSIAKTNKIYAIDARPGTSFGDEDDIEEEEEYNADGTVKKGKGINDDDVDDEEKIDLIGTFVREINQVVTFRSKFKPLPNELASVKRGGNTTGSLGSYNSSNQHQLNNYNNIEDNASLGASTIQSGSLASQLITQGRSSSFRDQDDLSFSSRLGKLQPLTGSSQSLAKLPSLDSVDVQSVTGIGNDNIGLGFDGAYSRNTRGITLNNRDRDESDNLSMQSYDSQVSNTSNVMRMGIAQSKVQDARMNDMLLSQQQQIAQETEHLRIQQRLAQRHQSNNNVGISNATANKMMSERMAQVTSQQQLETQHQHANQHMMDRLQHRSTHGTGIGGGNSVTSGMSVAESISHLEQNIQKNLESVLSNAFDGNSKRSKRKDKRRVMREERESGAGGGDDDSGAYDKTRYHSSRAKQQLEVDTDTTEQDDDHPYAYVRQPNAGRTQPTSPQSFSSPKALDASSHEEKRFKSNRLNRSTLKMDQGDDHWHHQH
jgi:hypothetical protein